MRFQTSNGKIDTGKYFNSDAFENILGAFGTSKRSLPSSLSSIRSSKKIPKGIPYLRSSAAAQPLIARLLDPKSDVGNFKKKRDLFSGDGHLRRIDFWSFC